MSGSRRSGVWRSYSAAALLLSVGALAFYVAFGHTTTGAMEPTEMHGLGICIVVVTLSSSIGLALLRLRPQQSRPALVLRLDALAVAVVVRPAAPRKTRASPIWLQCLLR